MLTKISGSLDNQRLYEITLSQAINNESIDLAIRTASADGILGKVLNSRFNLGVTAMDTLKTLSDVCDSSTAMDALAASSTAMTALAASSTAMNAIFANSNATNTIFSTSLSTIASSSIAMAAMIKSYIAMSTMIASSSTIDTLRNNSTSYAYFTPTVEYQTTTTFTVPSGVSCVTAIVVGMGGNGGNGIMTQSSSDCTGSPGTSGGYDQQVYSVTSGQTFTATIGTTCSFNTISISQGAGKPSQSGKLLKLEGTSPHGAGCYGNGGNAGINSYLGGYGWWGGGGGGGGGYSNGQTGGNANSGGPPGAGGAGGAGAVLLIY